MNFETFIGAVLPLAEELGVRLSLHPNDPPVHSIGGVPCLMTSKTAYDRAFAIGGGSPMLGMEFCCGCWLEGGQLLDASEYHVSSTHCMTVPFTLSKCDMCI
jgi:mannonate dehydratase